PSARVAPPPGSLAVVIPNRGASPRRTPLHAHSRAPASLPAPLAWLARAARSLLSFQTGGLRPAGPPYTLTRGHPLRCPLRSRGSLARLARIRHFALTAFPIGSASSRFAWGRGMTWTDTSSPTRRAAAAPAPVAAFTAATPRRTVA